MSIVQQIKPIKGIKFIWLSPRILNEKIERGKLEKIVALKVTIINLLNILIMIQLYDTSISNYQYQLLINDTIKGGLDGISIWLIFLVNKIIPIVIQDSWKTIKVDRKNI